MIRRPKPVEDIKPEQPFGFFIKSGVGKEKKPTPDYIYVKKLKSKNNPNEYVQVKPFDEIKYDVENLTEIDKLKVDQFNSTVREVTTELSDFLLQNSFASLLAQEKASANVQAIARDIFSSEVEIDSSALIAISNLSKLSLIKKHAERLNLGEDINESYFKVLAEGLANQTVIDMQREINNERISASLQNTIAVQRGRSESVNDNKVKVDKQEKSAKKKSKYVMTGDYGKNSMGVLKRKSYHTDSEKIVRESKEQLSGERIQEL